MDRNRLLERWSWAIVQLPFIKGGSFQVVPSQDCEGLPEFFGLKAKKAFDTGVSTVVDLFPSKEAAERFLQSISSDTARGIWEFYKERGLIGGK